MLQIKNLSVSYGAIEAVKNISLTVNDGEIVSLIGANGAGKPRHCIPSQVLLRRFPARCCSTAWTC